MAGGWTPTVHLFSQSLGKLRWDEAAAGLCAGRGRPWRRHSAPPGRPMAHTGLRRRLFRRLSRGCRGRGQRRAWRRQAKPRLRHRQCCARMPPPSSAPCRMGGIANRVRAFVDFQNDSTAKDLKLAVREGFRSVEHAKRYTTTGMATDQGKISNMPMLGIMAQAEGKTIPEIGFTTFRPPFTPTTFGNFAGAARGRPVRSGAPHADACLGGSGRRGLRGCGSVEARTLLPPRGRRHARRRRPRMPRGAPIPSASSMPRRSARSRWWGRMRPSS